MNTVLISSSRSPHGNTRRVAAAMAEVLSAQVITAEQATAEVLAAADLVGFGSGIYWMGFDTRITDLVHRLPDMPGKEAFVFATSGLPEPPFRRYTQTLRSQLEERGAEVVGVFVCRGIDTWGPFKLVGGASKTHPDDRDFAAARAFAAGLLR